MGMTPASQAEIDGPGGRPKVRMNKLLQEASSSSSGKATVRFPLHCT